MVQKRNKKKQQTGADRVISAGWRGFGKGLVRKPQPGETRGGNAVNGAKQGAGNQAWNEVPGGKLIRRVVKGKKPSPQQQQQKPVKRRRFL